MINGKLRAIDESYDLSQVIEEGTGLEHDTCCDDCGCELANPHDQRQVRHQIQTSFPRKLALLKARQYKPVNQNFFGVQAAAPCQLRL